MIDQIVKALGDILGQNRVSSENEVFANYISEKGILPLCVVWPVTSLEVQGIVELANKTPFGISVASSGPPRIHYASSPEVDNLVVVDLSRMKKILRVDRKNKVAIVEAGVTFNDLLPELTKAGLRPLMPFQPKSGKSVVASCIDREPTTMPRFHWDSSDPLLCTETVYGTSDLFRTGSAAGPGSLEEQWATGQAQKNPMGPSQYDPFRLLQGAQGTIGIVTWASIKCEALPDVHNVLLAGSEDLQQLIDFSYAILRRRLLDEHFILNRVALATALSTTGDDVKTSLSEWILVAGVSGRGVLSDEEIEYRTADSVEIADEFNIKLEKTLGGVNGTDVQRLLNSASEEPYWKLRTKGGFKEVFFTTTLDEIPQLFSVFSTFAKKHGVSSDSIGVYIQPTVQGVNAHCSFDLYFDPDHNSDSEQAKQAAEQGSLILLKNGAFFSRPYGAITDAVFEQSSPEMVAAMKNVKHIFDPNHILNPGKLCFKEVPK